MELAPRHVVGIWWDAVLAWLDKCPKPHWALPCRVRDVNVTGRVRRENI